MKTSVTILSICMLLTSCLRLDSNLFEGEKLTEYQFDAYTGKKELPNLPAIYNVDDSKKHLLTFTSSSDDGTAKIYAVYIGDMATINTDTVILYNHGTADHIDNYWNRAKLLANIGSKYRFGVLMIDYRGYGMSEGEASEDNMYADVDAALKWLQSKGVTNNRLIVYGYSLGSAPSCEIAANNYSMKPSKLILEAPFASAAVMVQDGSKLALPASYVTNLKIDNAEEIKKVTQPFCWMHGVDDDFLSITTHGEIVYKNYKGTYGESHKIPKAVHTDVPSIWGYTNYLNTLETFIER